MAKVNKNPPKSRTRGNSSTASRAKKSIGKKEFHFQNRLSTPAITLRAVAIVLLSLAMLFIIGTPKNANQETSAVTELQIPEILNQHSVLNSSSSSATATPSAKPAPPPVPVGPRVPILYYHYIEVNPEPVKDPGRDSLLITPSNFADQMITLKLAGYTTISYDDLAAGIKDPKTLPSKPILLTIDDGYSDFYTNGFPILQKLGMKATIFVLSRGADIKPGFYLSNSQILELSKSSLITVACHTEDHADLKGRSEAFQRQEIFGCKSQLESLIGMPVRHFAYPYGSFDSTSIRLVKEAGFITASSTIGGVHHSEASIYSLRRLHIGNYSGQHLISVLEALP